MQTSAQLEMEYTGVLIQPGELRMSPNHVGASVPTLCLFLELENPTHNTLQVYQPFGADEYAQCEAAARRHKKGMRVTVQAPLVGLVLVARNATHVHAISEPAATADSSTVTNLQEPELWQA